MAARDIKRASDFAEKHRISKAYGNYEELAQDSQVEIAYVGVTAPQHLQVVKIMLNAGTTLHTIYVYKCIDITSIWTKNLKIEFYPLF